MGQKVHPKVFRLGTKPQSIYNPTSPWSSNWFEDTQSNKYSKYLYQDLDLNSFFYKIYSKFGFSLQKFMIERKNSHIHIQLALSKINSSRKITKISRRLNRNKIASVHYAALKKRKLQQRYIIFLLTEKQKVKMLQKRERLCSKLKIKRSFNSRKIINLMLKEIWFSNKLQQRNREMLQYIKNEETQFELKVLPEIRHVVSKYLKVANYRNVNQKFVHFNRNSLISSKVDKTISTNFSSYLNKRYETTKKYNNTLNNYQFNKYGQNLPIYFTILKVPSLLHIFSQTKKSRKSFFDRFLKNLIKKDKQKKIIFPNSSLEQLYSPLKATNHLLNKEIRWNQALHLENKAILFKENLTAQTFATFIANELTKQHHSRHPIFRGALKGSFSKIWSQYKTYQEKQTREEKLVQIPLGIKIQCKGRWEGRDRTRQVVFKDGRIPLPTIDAPLDYAYVPFTNKYGTSGIKVWIFWKKQTLTSKVQLNSLTEDIEKKRLVFSHSLNNYLKKTSKSF